MLFDIVIPVGPNEKDYIETQLTYTRKNVIGYRYIFLIVSTGISLKIQYDDVNIIKENMFPFSIDDVAKYHGKSSRNGWYLQQLLKLYAGLCIPNIAKHYLVIDSDTCFLKPTEFFDDKDKPMYNYGSEYHLPYFVHMSLLHPSLKKMTSVSGICHHMVFSSDYVKRLIGMVEKYKKDVFWRVFLSNVLQLHYTASGASEYEIYFNYMLQYHPTDITIRKLNWINASTIVHDQDYDYISCHWYIAGRSH